MILTHRIATAQDIPALMALMEAAIVGNMKAFLSPAEIESARTTMGLDRSLIADGTYFIIEALSDAGSVIAGCGGWGKRRTLYGGDHSAGRDDRLADPATDAARIRAMYTHPDWTRRGVGTLLLDLGEDAARNAGFRSIELGSTLAGEPLYRARGYREIGRQTHLSVSGTKNVVIRMRKGL